MPADLGHELARVEVLQHDAAAVGIDPFEDHLHDPGQQLIDIERVAHRQRGAIHDLQIAAGAGQPGRRRLVVRRREDFAALGLVHRVHDPRAVLLGVPRDDVDLVGQVLDAAFGDAGVEQQRAAELQLVAAGQLVLLDLLAVDERAVGAAEVADDERVAAAAELGVLARDFGVVQLHGVRRAAAERDGRAVEPEARALIAALNHEQRWHDEILRGPQPGATLPAPGVRYVLKSLTGRHHAAASKPSILRIRGP